MRATRFIVTDHAAARLVERLDPHAVLMEELPRAVPFGAQKGNDELRLLPCGMVAVTRPAGRSWVVTTVLTVEQAVANMEAAGIDVGALVWMRRRAA